MIPTLRSRSGQRWRSTLPVLVSVLLMLGLLGAGTTPVAARVARIDPIRFADSAFERVWAATDAAVATGEADRTWLWGPGPFLTANEHYAEGVGGQRLVQYFDKGRMEITRPTADRDQAWFVTNGLLAREMIAGQLQIGDDQYRAVEPAAVGVAGDRDSPDAPTYAAFRAVATIHGDHRAPDRTGQLLNQAINVGGRVRDIRPRSEDAAFRFARYDGITGHNLLAAFDDYLTNQTEIDGLAVLGHPITEPYWIRVKLNGRESDIVVQIFERRALTFTPTNPEPWRIEMGNIGQHYWFWRYQGNPPLPVLTAEPATPGLPVRVRGFNWPSAGPMRLAITPPGEGFRFLHPTAITDSDGSLETTLVWDSEVADLYAGWGADLVILAEGPNGYLMSQPLLVGGEMVERVNGMVADVSRTTRLISLRLTLHLSLLGPATVIKKVVVTDQTVITRRADGASAVLGEINAGMGLDVRGRPGQAGALVADLIVIRPTAAAPVPARVAAPDHAAELN